MLTIIGAHSFHGPVRDGKGWVREAIAAKRRGWADDWVIRPYLEKYVNEALGFAADFGFVVSAAYCVFYLERCSMNLIQGYRVKPHGQLVLVSLTYYYASTPSLSTWWSSTTL